MKPLLMRIGVLGGTFDPIHNGHLALAKAALSQFKLDKVLFIPTFIPPHKMDRQDITPAPFRYRMTEMAVLDEPDFEVSDIEFSRPEISYTADTLRRLKEVYPGSDFFLIMGADSAAGLDSWKEPGEIMRMAKVLAAKRPGTLMLENENISWIDMPEYPVSSSQIRESLKKRDAHVGQFLPSKVEQYIYKMKLYGTSSKCL